jgi:hypothetical protein
LKRRQELKAKQEEREDKELKTKSREERPSQEDESVKPHDLEIIHPTSQTKPKNLLEAIFTKCLTLLKQSRKPPSIL